MPLESRKTRVPRDTFAGRIKVFCSSSVTVVILIFALALPISMIVMGSIHFHSCPAEHYVPVFLVVFGVFTVFMAVLRMLTDCCQSDNKKSSVAVVIVYVISIITGPFVTAWFIAGNVWVYRLRDNYSTDPSEPNYCNHTFYLYAFWMLTSLYIISGVVLVLLLVIGVVMLCRKLAG